MLSPSLPSQADLFEHAQSAGIHRNVLSLLSRRTDLRGAKVIDLACGDGRTTHFLRSRGADVTPCDLFPEHFKLADTAQFIDIQARTSLPDSSADLVILQEVFLTTPSRSSLASKLSYLCFESETMKLPPWGPRNSVWVADTTSQGRICYGHVWLIGIQQLRTLALLAGFSSVKILRSELSRSSLLLLLPFYLPLLLISLRATIRGCLKTTDKRLRRELFEQFKLNVNPVNLTNKFLIAVLRK